MPIAEVVLYVQDSFQKGDCIREQRNPTRFESRRNLGSQYDPRESLGNYQLEACSNFHSRDWKRQNPIHPSGYRRSGRLVGR